MAIAGSDLRTVRKVKSALACQEECAKEDECTRWTWVDFIHTAYRIPLASKDTKKKDCMLKSGNSFWEGIERSMGNVSGPKKC